MTHRQLGSTCVGARVWGQGELEDEYECECECECERQGEREHEGDGSASSSSSWEQGTDDDDEAEGYVGGLRLLQSRLAVLRNRCIELQREGRVELIDAGGGRVEKGTRGAKRRVGVGKRRAVVRKAAVEWRGEALKGNFHAFEEHVETGLIQGRLVAVPPKGLVTGQ